MTNSKAEIRVIIKAKKIKEVKNGVATYGDVEEKEIKPIQVTSAKIQNGEGDRTSVCQIQYFDPYYLLDRYLFERALLIGGIAVPENLFKSEEPEDTGSTKSSGGAYNPKDGIKGDDLAAEIVKYCNSVGVTDKSHQAAILGNITIETVMGEYTHEIGGETARYAPFYGRGLIQLTWKDNYERFGKFFNQDFVGNVDLVASLKWAIPIAVGGTTGANGCPTFTGTKMSDYGSGANFDWVNSRRTVNGTDKAELVASAGKKWLTKINGGLGKGSVDKSPVAKPETAAKPGATPEATPAATPTGAKPGTPPTPGTPSAKPAKPAIPKPDVNAVDDFIEIEIALGFKQSSGEPTPTTISNGTNQNNAIAKKSPKNFTRDLDSKNLGDIVTTSFYLTSRSTVSAQASSSIGGRGIRYVINKTSRQTYHNISLRQLTKRLGDDYGVGTIIPQDKTAEKVITVLQQNSETDYQFLDRVAKSQGFEVKSNGKALELVKPKESLRVKAKPLWGLSMSSSESADAQRIIKTLPKIDELVDGEAIAEGFNTNLSIANADIEVLSLQPGTILEIPENCIFNFSNVYCREYKIKAINIDYDGSFKVSLHLYIPVNSKPKSSSDKNSGDAKSTGNGSNSAIVAAAQKYVGKDFLPGQTECCMRFVRQVLKDANHPKADFVTKSPHDGLDTGINLASSLSGADCGTKIMTQSALQSGDIIFWGGTYGGYPPSTITHVGIAKDNVNTIDRSTSSKPVSDRAITTFQYFVLGMRLS